ncbi:putative inhibitor of apoptosis [Haliotis asinina]|uniref:putative inhibitor of apoptosis n=1 Tax=Haliotis asinina TaxID=109174 RepID=UPI003531A003
MGDKVECERCGLKLFNWTDTDDALHEHATRRTHCPFIVSLYRKLGQTPPPKHPKYQSLQARLDSFVGWPRRYVPKTPEELASAGFFYIGSADRVTCFQCGITLRDWEEEHDPVAEHQRYSEHCQFINKTDLNQLGVATRTLQGTTTNPQLLDNCTASEANLDLNTTLEISRRDTVFIKWCKERDIIRTVTPSLRQHIRSTDSSMIPTDTWAAREWGGTDSGSDSFTRRLATYDDSWAGKKDRHILARAGFTFTGIGDKVECERCGLKLFNWTDTDDALHEHATRRTHCPFIVSLYRKLGQTPPPKHPNYQSLQARLDSFVGWPRRYVPKTPEELASAGFFYIGSADRVTCFQCGITLRDWEEEHDPVAEHQRYSEHCQFINKTDLNQLGVATRTGSTAANDQAGVKTEEVRNTQPSTGSLTSQVVKQNPSKPSGASQDVTVTDLMHCIATTGATYQDKFKSASSITSQTTSDDLTSPVAPPMQLEGHNPSSGRSVPTSEQKSRSNNTSSPPTTRSSSDTNPVQTSTEDSIVLSSLSLAEQNRRLRERRTCKICKTEVVSELFLPCGHLVTCSLCAPKVTDCCVCRKTILGTVKVFLP